MASERSASSNNLDEHLAKVRDKSLNEGENIVIQAMGDVGQAIVFTDSRVFILKAGITATGSVNGEKATVFANEEISCIRLRRGPMGAVIQVISTQTNDDPQIPPPDNIIIFNGDDKIKKCETVVTKMENMGLNIERIGFENEAIQETAHKTVSNNSNSSDEVIPQKTPAKKKVRKSLAEEMYDEITNVNIESKNTIEPVQEEQKHEEIDFDLGIIEEQCTAKVPVISQDIIEEIISVKSQIEMPTPVKITQITDIEKSAEETTKIQLPDFRPNPRLPRPVSQIKNNKNQILVLFGLLAILIVGGIAFMKPINKPAPQNKVTINIIELTLSPESIRKQLEDIKQYKNEAFKIINTSNDAARYFIAAFKSNSKTAQYDETLNNSWKEMDALSAPSGLASVKQNLTKALFDRKTAVANTEAGFNDNISQTINTLSRIDKTIEQNFKAIDEDCSRLKERSKQSSEKNKK